MRIAAFISFVSVAFVAQTFAAPNIAVDIVVTESIYAKMDDYPIGSKVIARTHRVIESGKSVMIRAARIEFTVTPKLLHNGLVDYSEAFTKGYNKPKAQSTLISKRKPVPVGSPLEVRVCIGHLDFATRTSIPK